MMRPMQDLFRLPLVTPLFLAARLGRDAVFDPSSAYDATITAQGYPVSFMKILGVAKLPGILAIATGLSPTLKEWV
jgi:hypothetical protein